MCHSANYHPKEHFVEDEETHATFDSKISLITDTPKENEEDETEDKSQYAFKDFWKAVL